MDMTQHHTDLGDETPEENRHRDPEETLRALLDSPDFPFTQIRQLQIGWFASGEVAARYQPMEDEEWVIIGLP